MVDLTSLQAFHETVPDAPKELFVSLGFKGYSAASRKRSVAALAKAGYLGCYPLGDASGAKIVLRPQPGRPLGESPVGIASTYVEGTTFSPDVVHWVAARIAFIKGDPIAAPYDAHAREGLIAYAEQFGGTESARRVLKVLAGIGKTEYRPRVVRVTTAVEPGNALLATLANLWATFGEERLEWVNRQEPPDPIVAGAQLATNLFLGTGRDLTQAALMVIRADALFDFSYGYQAIQSGGDWKKAPLAQAPACLTATKLVASDALLLKAAEAFASEPSRYDGSLHLDAARAIAPTDPTLAYVQTINAGAFHARAKKTPPLDAATFARKLAQQHGWTDIVTLLDWSEPGLR